LVLCVGFVMCACDRSEDKESGRSTGTTTANVEITSSLEGMKVLPRRVRWTATTSLPPERIKHVRFLVDRQRLWTDQSPPFSYGEEGAYLVASIHWIPGLAKRHFTVRVAATDGSVWKETVVAQVPKPQISRRVPAYGLWGRLAPNAPRDQDYDERSYTAELSIYPGELWVGRSYEQMFIYELSADARRFSVGVPVFLGSHDRGIVSSGRHVHGYQCPPDGPPAVYTWSWTKDRFGPFSGKHLVLTAEQEPCTPRQQILEGLWELWD
jgi:hypothetical protein